jgi:iron complex outermembrane receptor protein
MKRTILCGASAAAVTMAAGLLGSPALAQTAEPPTAGQDIGANVTVVAQKRSESIEKVPVAVTAFSQKDRDIIGIKTINDMANFTPGLSYFNGDDRTFIRGIGRQTDLLSVSPGVAIYKDGVYAGGNGSIALQQDTLFVDRIEVDRGPQSTLYGRNSDGGAVNYIWRRPTSTWQEEVRGGVNNYSKYYAEALVSGPLNDHIRVLFGGNYFQENGGYWKNLIGHAEGGDIAQGGNGTSHYVVGQIAANWDKFDWWAKASTGGYLASWYQGPDLGSIDDSEFPGAIGSPEPSQFFGLCSLAGNTGLGCGSPFSPDSVVPGSAVLLGHVADTTNVANANRRNFIGGRPNTTSVRDDFQISTTLTFHAPGADIKYTGGYESFLYQGLFTGQNGNATSGLRSYQLAAPAIADPACTFLYPATAGLCTQPLTINAAPNYVIFIEDEQFYSHELAISSTYQGPLQYIAGIYWFHDHYDQPIHLAVGNQPQFLHPADFLTFPALAPPSSLDAPIQTDRAGTLNDYAAYGELDWKATDTLKFTAGVRYTTDKTSGFIAERFLWFNNPFLGVSVGTFGANTPALDVTTLFAGASGGCNGSTASIFFPPGHAAKGAGPCIVRADGYVQQALNATFSAVTGTAGVEWTPDSHTLAYLKYSRGYKNGAFDTPQIVSTPETPPEFVDDYEAGLKLSHPTWQLNADVFYYNYTNDQQPLTVNSPLPGGGFTPVGELFALPSVHTWGIELEGIWHPIEPLVINAQYSYLSAKIASTGGLCLLDTVDPNGEQPGANSSGCPAGGLNNVTQNVVGQYLPEAPANKYSLNAIYTFQFDPGSLALSGSVVWRDKAYGTIFNRPYDTIPAYTLINLRAVWNDAKNRFTVVVFADNILNTLWADNVAGALLSSGFPQLLSGKEIINRDPTYGAPATVGVEVQVRWR